ncbi:hypothetical protein BJ741DRAFT_711856 [Chytriomyces cf. hyalinus JEL632]|nr:hypothetical protein BJ741DRAFT_711856 [Chytriomyces cf. hyalinus JEL632]
MSQQQQQQQQPLQDHKLENLLADDELLALEQEAAAKAASDGAQLQHLHDAYVTAMRVELAARPASFQVQSRQSKRRKHTAKLTRTWTLNAVDVGVAQTLIRTLLRDIAAVSAPESPRCVSDHCGTDTAALHFLKGCVGTAYLGFD